MSMSDWQDKLIGPPGSPERAEFERHYRWYKLRMRVCEALTGWLRVFGPLGRLAATFWFLVLTEGDPRGGLTFSFLNDGYRPTWWHTWYSINHDNLCPYTGIYPEGAPGSLMEAYERDEAYKAKRAAKASA